MDLDTLQTTLTHHGISAKICRSCLEYSRHVAVKMMGGDELRVRSFADGKRWAFNNEESFVGTIGDVVIQIISRNPLCIY